FSSRRRHTRCYRDWSSDVCSSDLTPDDLLRRSAATASDARRKLGDLEESREQRQLRDEALRGLHPQHFSDACPYFIQLIDAQCRSEERRVGKGCRVRWSQYQAEKT